MQIEVDPKKNSSTQPLVPFPTDPLIAAAASGTSPAAPGAAAAPPPAVPEATPDGRAAGRRRETGGPAGPEPTRFGDWERNGRCIDF